MMVITRIFSLLLSSRMALGEVTEVETCAKNLYDCAYPGIPNSVTTCAPYNHHYADPRSETWAVALSGIVSAFMAFFIGANDAANSWGTSVGSHAISLTSACMIGGVMEWLGAVLLGFGVSDSIRKGVASIKDPDCWACGRCDSKMSLYLVGMFAALLSAGIFLMLATFTAFPVSTTHAIVGAVVGVTIVGTKWSCLNWSVQGGLGGIALSWVISPLFAGTVAALLWYVLHRGVIRAARPVEAAKVASPIVYMGSIFFVFFMILMKSKVTKSHMSRTAMVITSLAIGALAGALSHFFLNPRVLRAIERRRSLRSALDTSLITEGKGADGPGDASKEVELVASVPPVPSDTSLSGRPGARFGEMQGGSGSDPSAWGDQDASGRLLSARRSDLDDSVPIKAGESDAVEDLVHRSRGAEGETGTSASAAAHFRRRSVEVVLVHQDPAREDGMHVGAAAGVPGAAVTSGGGGGGGGTKVRSSDPGEEDPAEAAILDVVGKSKLGKLWLERQQRIEREEMERSALAKHGPGAAAGLSGEQQDAMQFFRYLLILVAALESLAHGANDTSNASAAFAAAVETHKSGLKSCSNASTPWLVQAYAGFFVAVGVNVLGYRVIKTMGSELVEMDYLKGFATELATAITVVLCTVWGYPVSSTHCQVGGVIAVGLVARGARHVEWRLFGKIGLSWVCTVPFSAVLAMVLMAMFRPAVIV